MRDIKKEFDQFWDCVEFLQCSTAIAAIAATLDHLTRPQAGAVIH